MFCVGMGKTAFETKLTLLLFDNNRAVFPSHILFLVFPFHELVMVSARIILAPFHFAMACVHKYAVVADVSTLTVIVIKPFASWLGFCIFINIFLCHHSSYISSASLTFLIISSITLLCASPKASIPFSWS